RLAIPRSSAAFVTVDLETRREEECRPHASQASQDQALPRQAQGEASARAAAPQLGPPQHVPVIAMAPSAPFSFSLEARAGAARVGVFTTPHGAVHTPAFMPAGTHGAGKALAPEQVAATGAEMVLANPYHLALRPGEALVAKLGGLHDFMRWKGPILTDSGGFQGFSPPKKEISDPAGGFTNA